MTGDPLSSQPLLIRAIVAAIVGAVVLSLTSSVIRLVVKD